MKENIIKIENYIFSFYRIKIEEHEPANTGICRKVLYL